MITTELYNGQGLGNQLWCYVVTRCIANEKNFKFGIMNSEKFKGKDFLDIDFGENITGGEGPEGGPPAILPNKILYYYKEKGHNHPKTNIFIGKKDENIYNIKDFTKIDGVMQSIEYIEKHREEIKNWIKIKENKNVKKYTDNDQCIIHIRGGDFFGSSALLDKNYYDKCMEKMIQKNHNIKFYIITDDYQYAKRIYPYITIIGGASLGQEDPHKAQHHLGGLTWIDWTILKNCKNVILSASSFSWWPIWLNDDVNVLAPMYWADYKNSDGYWSCGDSLIKNWTYLNRNGQFYSYDECKNKKEHYEKKFREYWE